MDLFESSGWALSVVDALASGICVLDRQGTIRAENDAWLDFSRQNGGLGSYIGANYLEICDRAGDRSSDAADRMAEAIRQVLAGTRDSVAIEYPCPSPEMQRWFRATVTPLRIRDGSIEAAVIAHQEVTQQQSLKLELERLVITDPLTRLPNRRSLQAQIERERISRGQCLALVLLDLDNFKDINDRFGHDTGDCVLQQVADRIGTAIARWQCATAARMGGDEFAVLLQTPQAENVVPLVADLLASLGQPYRVGGESLYSGASAGIAFHSPSLDTAQCLLKAADLALYKAKDGGGNRYAVYTPALSEAAEQRAVLFAEAREGFARGAFEAYFQPIVRLADKSLSGFEALVRWQHPRRGLLAPGQFLPVLKDRRLSTEISEIVLRQVIEQLSAWKAEGLPSFTVSVNVTLDQLQDPDFFETLCSRVSAASIDPRQLKLEITEDVVIGDTANQLSHLLTRLRDAGFAVSLDDFGTGFASMTHLIQFPLDEIKIDMGFVRQLKENRSARAVVRSLTHLAHTLGLGVVAEGVEDAEVEGIVAALQCDRGQGYLFSKPQPASAIPDLVRQWDDLTGRTLPFASETIRWPRDSLARSSVPVERVDGVADRGTSREQTAELAAASGP